MVKEANMAMHLNGMESMDNGAVDYEEWHPPSEAELKVIEARREHQDKISKLMGDYLLKGYKMLGSTCPVCETILLRTKQGVDYCVACSELDSDATKDDPALNEIAAQRQAQESQLKEAPSASEASGGPKRSAATSPASSSAANASRSNSNSRMSSHLPLDVGAKGSNSVDGVGQPLPKAVLPVPGLEVQLRGAAEVVVRKLEWATGLLGQTQDIDTCVRLCGLIKSCADTIHALRSVDCRDLYNISSS